MIENLIFIIILLAFILASYEDIKKREVYDYLNFSLVFIIIVFALFDSIVLNSAEPIKYVGFGLILGFLIGSILYYLGIWGGGDAKFLIGFGGAIYYIKDFNNTSLFNLENFYEFLLNLISYGFNFFIQTFLKFILILDVVFIFAIFLMFFTSNLKKEEKKSLIYLIFIFSILFFGLYLNLDSFILIVLGFLVFVLIFFAEENVFNSVYFKIKKKIKNLEEYDIVDSEIKHNGKILISYKDGVKGLTKENLISILEHGDKNSFIYTRKILPYSMLIGFNYILYVMKIITLDSINLSILSFMLEFMLYSFIAGGIISLLLIFYFYLKNYEKCGIIFSKKEKLIIYLSSLTVILLSIIWIKLLILLLIAVLYATLKISKKIEKHMFVKKKDLDKIVPGDWIAEDIFVNGKKLYSIENFKLGIDEEQIKKLKELCEKDNNLKSIYVKDGLAFLPPLFIGFLIIIFL